MSSPLRHRGLRAFLDSLTGEQEIALVHLLCCPSCRHWTEELLHEDLHHAEDDAVYTAMWRRLEQSIPWMVEVAGRRRAAARGLLQELLSYCLEDRAGVLDLPCFHSLDLLDLLLEESRTAQPGDCKASAALALLARQMATCLREELGESLTALYYARETILRANALRLASPALPSQGQAALTAAEDLLRSAAHFLAWPFESWDRAAYCRTLALVRWEQGALDEAAALLQHAARGFAEHCLPREEGACFALLGLLSMRQNRRPTAAGFLQRGLLSLDPGARPWLTVRVELSLALALADLGQAEPARALLRQAQRRYPLIAEEREHVRIRWHEARVLGQLDEKPEAESLLSDARRKLISEYSFAEAVLCSHEHAAVLLALRRPHDVPGLLQEVESVFTAEAPALDALRRLFHPILSSGQELREIPQELALQAEQNLQRVLRFRGYRVESLPFA